MPFTISKKAWTGLAATVAVALIGVFAWMFVRFTHDAPEPIRFSDVTPDKGIDVLSRFSNDHVVLDTVSGDQEAVLELLGAVVIRSKIDGKDRWTFDYRFRPDRSKVSMRPLDDLMYRGVVSGALKADGFIQPVSAGLSADELAEITVQNVLVISHANSSDIPFQQLRNYRTDPEKEYYFVDRLVVTTINTRKFRKHQGDTALSGMAFGANGSIYTSQEEIQSFKKVSFRSFDIAALKNAEAGPAELQSLIPLAVKGTLDSSDVNVLLRGLRSMSQGRLPAAIRITEPLAAVPGPVQGFKRVVWFDNVRPIRQWNSKSCWAAATAMLLSYQRQRGVSEREAVVSAGPLWAELHRRRAPLLQEHKLRFLSEAGLKFLAPQNFFPEGLAKLLTRHGPLWFTIDLAEGLHASVVTGMFLNEASSEYWVVYIDPSDGELKADLFNSFMRRYEEPAWREMDVNPAPPETFADLFIQVVHL